MAGFAPAPLPHLSLVLEEVVTGSSGEAAFLPHVGLVFEPNQFTLTCEAGSYALTGQDAALWYVPTTANAGDPAPLPHLGLVLSGGFDGIIADPGAFTVTGVSDDLRVGRKLVAAAGSFSLTGQDATLSYTVNSVEFPAPLPHLSLVLTGVEGVYGLPAASGAFTLTGQDAALRKGVGVIAATGSFLFTGAPALRDLQITAEHGQFDLISVGATLTGTHLPLTADAGAFVFDGFAAGLEYSGELSMLGSPGSFLVDPQGQTLTFGRALLADAGAFVLSGQDSTYTTTGTVTPLTKYPAPAGRSRRKRQSVVDVDGELVRVNSRAEADELLKRIRAQAKEEAPKAAKRALNKARDIARKEGVFPDVRVQPPRVEPVDTSDALAAMIERINADVAKEYERAQREAELAYLARKTYIEQDEEDALIALLL